MWARITRVEGETPEGITAATHAIEAQVVPALKDMDGFKGILTMTTEDRRTGITIAFWDSQAAMAASEAAVTPLRQDAADASGGRIVSVERCEVVLEHSLTHA